MRIMLALMALFILAAYHSRIARESFSALLVNASYTEVSK